MYFIETIIAIEWKEKICGFFVEKGICKGLVWVFDKIKPPPVGTLNEYTQSLHKIKDIASSHFKGQRGPFTFPEEYTIQRYCSYKLDTDDYVRCFLEQQEII